MKSDRHVIWMEWGFRLFVLLLLGLWLLVPTADVSETILPLAGHRGVQDE